MSEDLTQKAKWLRRAALDLAVQGQSGHVAPAFSCAEILIALYYGGILRFDPKNPRAADRDRFVLSKGHGSLALYPILADLGFFDAARLGTYGRDGAAMGVHVSEVTPGVEVSTGSLGHGLPIATGMAQALLDAGSDALIVVLTGDAELYEGTNYEAMIYAAHADLHNLVVIVDRNKMGMLGRTEGKEQRTDGPALGAIESKFMAFGWEVRGCDGHDFASIFAALQPPRYPLRDRAVLRQPLAVVAQTVKGYGSAVFADKRGWHHHVPQGADLEAVRRDLE